MKIKFTYLIISGLLALLAIPSSSTMENFQLLTKNTAYVAGNPIILKFSNTNEEKPRLYVSNSYGSTVIKSETDSEILNFNIPELISNKTGIVNWKLLGNQSLSGKFYIHPKQKTETLEIYLGPPSIAAGGSDYSMFVVIPTDIYDNPLADSTKVTVKHQFLENENDDTIIMKNRIAYTNIYSESKTGRILVSSECLGLNSKENTINVMPGIPTNFSISSERNHDYSDGNQITTFSTSIIKDTYGNIVSDGTFVNFFITNTSKNILKTSGTTLNGIAFAKMIHPDHEENWTVKAIIEGMAESDVIELSYKSIISDFQVTFAEDNRTITVGPLKSFMDQMIPDGLEVLLSVYKNDQKLKTLSKSSSNGYAIFTLDKNTFPSKTYTLKIKAAKIEKSFINTKL
ncbi:hypothetical protein JBL43_14285 [Aureibaculum sp. A20]|uniref:T9SS C-terminal target domain-containing protein n=1 Tax=Aureibaculum flavum TaxID=2795986 RepID=A0ABS0WTY4_9FLAO|nr:hypothetical protein [Aureibaculum flavum]MBJ2175418.1 hypothetical protein [Aureibaculum flavum]